MRQSRGVLPKKQDSVIKDPAAAGSLLLVTLRPDLNQAGVVAWLARVDALAKAVQAATSPDGRRTGTVAVGFGRSFFTRAARTPPPISSST